MQHREEGCWQNDSRLPSPISPSVTALQLDGFVSKLSGMGLDDPSPGLRAALRVTPQTVRWGDGKGRKAQCAYRSCSEAGISLGTGGKVLTSTWRCKELEAIAILSVTVFPGRVGFSPPVHSAALSALFLLFSSLFIPSSTPAPASQLSGHVLPEMSLIIGVSTGSVGGPAKSLPVQRC